MLDGVGVRRSCPVSTGGGTRCVKLGREGRGGGGARGRDRAPELDVRVERDQFREVAAAPPPRR